MKLWLLVPVDIAGGESLRELLAPFTGETNRLDGWRPGLVWVKGGSSEHNHRDGWDRKARDEFRNFVNRDGGLAVDLVDLGATEEQLREAFDIRDGEDEDAYVQRKQVVPYAFLYRGDWVEQAHGESDEAWAGRFNTAYAQVPDGTVCVWVRCHR